ncbi:MAG TPA: hypothetical protein VK766_06190, partial [Cytophagaceae bacterium]|nr:hypothetical protein [Cytophagaceae bacterium]
MRKFIILLIFFISTITGFASQILVPMDNAQRNHLKAYGIAYWILTLDQDVNWLLNYRNGSFMFAYNQKFENELIIRGVTYEVISDAQSAEILNHISSPDMNMEVMKLEKPPKIAVYSPKTKLPWDDAVTMVLTYAEIPYTTVFDDEVLYNELPKYDWLHLHHEDFTGQYGKFYAQYKNQPWYIKQQKEYEASAKKHGFKKVSELKLAVVKKIRDFCASGGFLFAMCSATDTYDIALAADGVDI